MVSLFDGPAGAVAAKVMAIGNRDMEAEAVAELAPDDSDAVLVIGFGPGVGIRMLLPHLPQGWIGGIDPSGAMVREARRRNRAAFDEGRLRLEQTTAAAIPWGDASFDGAIAVNSVQLWDPLDASAAEVARVLRPGAPLVTITHDWALRKHAGSVEEWLETVTASFEGAGFEGCRSWTGKAASGGSVTLVARRYASAA
jgi:ubiquinone/menaquinone biosynthesis C-methylase UbiE